MRTDAVGPVVIDVPRDRDGSFEPVIIKKHQRRLGQVDEIILSLTARGLTTGEISAHFQEIYGASVSKDTISRTTDKVTEEMASWLPRPLEQTYAAIFIDALIVKVRDGQVANRPFYAAIGVDLEGRKDILGLWAGDGGGESSKFWLAVLTDLRNRDVLDVFFLTVLCSTKAIESLNARYRRATKARGHFPTEQSALKCLYQVTRSLNPTGRGTQRWAVRWKPALNAFAITFADRIPGLNRD